jgi:hypothetical protein
MTTLAHTILAAPINGLSPNAIESIAFLFLEADYESSESLIGCLAQNEQAIVWHEIESKAADPKQLNDAAVRWLLCGGVLVDAHSEWVQFINWWSPRDKWFTEQDLSQILSDKETIYEMIKLYSLDKSRINIIKPPSVPNYRISSKRIPHTCCNRFTPGKQTLLDHLFAYKEYSDDQFTRLHVLRFFSAHEQKKLLSNVIQSLKKSNAPLSHLIDLLLFLTIPSEDVEGIFKKHGIKENMSLPFKQFDRLNDLTIRSILKETSSPTLICALIYAPETVKNKFLANMNDRAQRLLIADIGVVRVSQAEAQHSCKEIERCYQKLCLQGVRHD